MSNIKSELKPKAAATNPRNEGSNGSPAATYITIKIKLINA
jgi:hypothetical protein